jgi:superoxide dismutase, Cu-Zn family
MQRSSGMSRITVLSLVAGAVAIFGCESGDRGPAAEAAFPEPAGVVLVDPGAERPEPATAAIAVLHPTEGSTARGVVRFEEREGGLAVIADAAGLPPGPHAFHIHLHGDCSGPDAETAGTHFNLHGPSEHPPPDIDRITGDLGELHADASGEAHAEAFLRGASLHGTFSILARSVVVHVRGNDPSKPPMGDAGGRLGCGVIGISPARAHV